MKPTWQTSDGSVKLFLGDCLDVLPTLDVVDAVVTDPPYGIGERTGTISETRQHKNDYVGMDDSMAYIETVVLPAFDMCVKLARTIIVTPGSKAAFYYPQPTSVGGFYQPAAVGMCSWGRQTFQPILFYGPDPHAGKTIQHTTYKLTEAATPNGHPCPKPLKAWTWVVTRASREGETILDPFMGSGTTGVACVRTGRKFIGIEKEERYFDIAAKRIEAELNRAPLFEPPAVVQRELI
jgi:DNA modification methylase